LRWGRIVLAAATAASFLALASLSIRQTAVWKDSVSLWSAVIEREPTPPAFAYYNRAAAFQESGRTREALADYGRALALDPESQRYFINRGLLLLRIGRIGAAVADFQSACRLGNDFGCQAARLYQPAGAPAGKR